MKLREFFLSVKEQLEEYNEHLKDKLNKANIKLEEHQNDDERTDKIFEMMVAIDIKTNNFLEEMEGYSKELELIQRAVKDDSFEIPGIIVKPTREELEKYINSRKSGSTSSRKSTIDLSGWASKHHPAYRK
ncbi:MAG: hypothetical protein KJ558_11025 [Gammaproteobacteria bacterium]|nr:hypothetical protein [Gammaproteobacteria bacterium]MBU1655340.1 hypothetical protein [Gammaproteobacteria bacterium]